MSLGESAGKRRAALRAMAHPVRLQITSLLTGAALTAAEIARELGLTHANASYHLRSLLAAGIIVPAGEERIRGGLAKRYRYDPDRDRGEPTAHGRQADAANRALYAALAQELVRRTALGDFSGRGTMTDADLWVEPGVWLDVRNRMAELSRELHAAARPARTPGTIRTSTTIAMFQMETDR
jgi:DNA-binding transcriptional ArsR family regulator